MKNLVFVLVIGLVLVSATACVGNKNQVQDAPTINVESDAGGFEFETDEFGVTYDDWRQFESSVVPVTFDYAQNWYYTEYTGDEVAMYNRYFGFTDKAEILDDEYEIKKEDFFIEFIVLSKEGNEELYSEMTNLKNYKGEDEFTMGDLKGYTAIEKTKESKNYVVFGEKNDKLYFFRLINTELYAYEHYLDQMARTLNFTE